MNSGAFLVYMGLFFLYFCTAFLKIIRVCQNVCSVPQVGSLYIMTEQGRMDIPPGYICVIPVGSFLISVGSHAL